MTSSPQFTFKKNLGSDLKCQPNIFVLQALLKNLGSDLQCQPNIFVLQAFLKKLHGADSLTSSPPRVK